MKVDCVLLLIGRLKILNDGGMAVRWQHISGHVTRPTNGSAINGIEANAVVKEIERLVLQQRYSGSIGVVSPFKAQAVRIRELVNQKESLSDKLARMDFIADTAHGFQGDERDIIIFSPVVSSGITEGAIAFLRNMPNLFNVAITRTRAALVVIGDKQAALDSRIEHLAKFAVYVDQIGSKNTSHAQPNNLGSDYPSVSHPEHVSDWEKTLYNALFSAGYRPIPQYNVEKYDLAG